ncbi:hypothetical protein ACVKU6_001393 [Stenotrophomonas sp. PvP086]|uniref:hypothetical protein n=1 Tax=Stenotrophomonas sp. PvP087 TaxID=3156434 RepID=UPI0036D62BD7
MAGAEALAHAFHIPGGGLSGAASPCSFRALEAKKKVKSGQGKSRRRCRRVVEEKAGKGGIGFRRALGLARKCEVLQSFLKSAFGPSDFNFSQKKVGFCGLHFSALS